tara:strand:- start:219 stop:677 length:459 start_codon:yes stop_codon:yes gene_type:complete
MTTTITGALGIDNIKAATGAVLQVVTMEYATSMTLATTTYTDSGLSLSITPSSTSSKILAFWNMQANCDTAGSGYGTKLVRVSTSVWTSTNSYDVLSQTGGDRLAKDYRYLDSPNTASAITYKVQVSSHASRTIYINGDGTQTQLTLMEVAG